MRRLHRPRLDDHKHFYVRLVVLVLLVAYAVAFVVQNDHRVSVCFVFVTAHVSLIWVILLALAVGLLGGLLMPRLERRWRRSRKSAEPRDSV